MVANSQSTNEGYLISNDHSPTSRLIDGDTSTVVAGVVHFFSHVTASFPKRRFEKLPMQGSFHSAMVPSGITG